MKQPTHPSPEMIAVVRRLTNADHDSPTGISSHMANTFFLSYYNQMIISGRFTNQALFPGDLAKWCSMTRKFSRVSVSGPRLTPANTGIRKFGGIAQKNECRLITTTKKTGISALQPDSLLASCLTKFAIQETLPPTQFLTWRKSASRMLHWMR